MAGSNCPQAPLRARVAIDQVRLARLSIQNAIERSRASLAETRVLLVALRFAVKNRDVGPLQCCVCEGLPREDIFEAYAHHKFGSH
jgi:hypothetical protein